MGLFDLSKGGDGGLKKHAGRAANKRAQAQDRWQSLQALGAMKSPEAVEALLERFTYRVDPSITDQEEKELAMAGVVGAGDAAELPLRRFLAKSESVAWPVKMLEAIAGADTVVETLVGLLADMDTEYERDPQKKIDTLGQLEDRRDGRIVPAVLPFFEDMNEAARFHAVAAALVQDEPTGDEAEPFRAALLAQLAEEDSTRVRSKILDGLIARGWGLGEGAAELREKLPDGYVLDGEQVRKR
ncbi:MAG: HEAT repeat domain-containing protein [Myxococcota bacterium]